MSLFKLRFSTRLSIVFFLMTFYTIESLSFFQFACVILSLPIPLRLGRHVDTETMDTFEDCLYLTGGIGVPTCSRDGLNNGHGRPWWL